MFNRLKISVLAFCLVLLCGFVSPAGAQDAGRLTLAREVIEISGSLDQVDDALESIRPLIVAQMQQSGNLTPTDAQRVSDLLLEEITASKPQMADAMARAFAERFTTAQLQDMRTFYASPTGVALRQNLGPVMDSLEGETSTIGEQAALRAIQRFLSERADRRR